jgi:hypothetical protein
MPSQVERYDLEVLRESPDVAEVPPVLALDPERIASSASRTPLYASCSGFRETRNDPGDS